MSRLAAGVGWLLAVCLLGVALGFAVAGQPHYAVTAALGAVVAVQGYRVARMSERLDRLDAPRRRCGWCNELYRDPAAHASVCQPRRAMRGRP